MAVESGEVRAQVLESSEKMEVAVAGTARVRISADCFLARFEDIENFKKGAAVVSIHQFATPIRARDLEGLNLDPADVAALHSCVFGDCKVKLPPGTVERLHRVDWSRSDHEAAVQSIFREQLLGYLKTYLREGNSALLTYHDKREPVSLAKQFLAVLDARPGLAELSPKFREYLAQYPNLKLPGVREFLYWSKESFGLKPVISVTHVYIYAQPGRALIASKQIYANHYLDASLGITAVLSRGEAGAASGMYLVYLNRSRIDLLSGLLGGLRRSILNGRLREGMRKNLEETAGRLESSCADWAADSAGETSTSR